MAHPQAYPDETDKIVAIAAETPNLDLRRVLSTMKARLDPAKVFATLGEPVLTFANLEWFHPLFTAMAADGAKVVLDGRHGNMGLTFDGTRGINDFLPFIGNRRSGDPGPLTLLPLIAPMARAKGSSPFSYFCQEVVKPHAPVWLREWRRRRRHRAPPWAAYAALSEEAVADLSLATMTRQGEYDPYYVHGANSRALRRRILMEQAANGGTGGAITCLLYGLERRSPLGDVRLLEFCLAIPTEQYMLDGVPRSLIRRLVADRLPTAVVNDNRRGLQDPQRLARFATRLDEWRADLDRLKQSPLGSFLLDIKRLRQLIDTWPEPGEYAYNAASAPWRLAVPRAMHLAHFILWSERGNTAPP